MRILPLVCALALLSSCKDHDDLAPPDIEVDEEISDDEAREYPKVNQELFNSLSDEQKKIFNPDVGEELIGFEEGTIIIGVWYNNEGCAYYLKGVPSTGEITTMAPRYRRDGNPDCPEINDDDPK